MNGELRLKKIIIIMLVSVFGSHVSAQGPYAPAAGQPGSTAIHKDSSVIVNWATGIELRRGYINISDTSVYDNNSNLATYGYPSLALGEAVGDSYDIVSLGDSGMATLTFDRQIINGSGPDFAVFENGFSDTSLELAFVEVSSDGIHFIRFPAVSLTPDSLQVGGFDPLDPTNLYNLAGKYRQGYGVPFDLEEIKDSANLDVDNIRFVRVVDVIGSVTDPWACYDSQGNIVNDPWPYPYSSCGFDLEAVGIINAGETWQLSVIDDLTLEPDTFWNGSDGSGGFVSGQAHFTNVYDSVYFSWSGYAYSNMRDDSTTGFANQYSAITGGGMDATDSAGSNYAVAYVILDWMSPEYDPVPVEISFTDSAAHDVMGFYVTNSTYTALSMQYGDDFAKKFGGETGNDPDWLKLSVWGTDIYDNTTDTVEFFLADYRFEDNTKDYIVKDWRWVDLTALGKVKNVMCSLSSTDTGPYGMNTPGYFCMDNLTVHPEPFMNIAGIPEQDIRIYPNPADNYVCVKSQGEGILRIFDVTGKTIYLKNKCKKLETIDISAFSKGLYIFSITLGNNIITKKIIIE